MRALALVLTCLTGFSGLVYEVTWQKYLATLLGSHSEATAAVLAIFLGGLAVGYQLFGRVSGKLVARGEREGRAPRLLLTYGLVEGAIGVYAFAFPLLFRAAMSLSVALPGADSALGFALDVVLAALLIGPPTVLMGATIPFLTQVLPRDLDDATRLHALVYATNTAGAFAGALAAGFWLVPALGLVRVLWLMGAVNVVAGLCFLALGRREAGGGLRSTATQAVRTVRDLPVFLAVALLSGFAMMAVQTVLIRLGGLSFGSSYFTFSMVVAVFVLCIALGSFAVSAFSRIPGYVLVANQWLLAAFLLALYPLLEQSIYWAHVLRTVFRDQPEGFAAYHLLSFLGVLAVIGIPVMLAGAVLPLIFHHLRHRVGDLGSVAGRLYGWNTVGSLLGALLGGYVLFFWLDLHAVYRVALGAVIVSAGLLTAELPKVPRLAVVGVLPLLAGLMLLEGWDPERLASGLFRNRQPFDHSYNGPDEFYRIRGAKSSNRIRFYTDDPVASVAVVETPFPNGDMSYSIVNNGKSDGSLHGDYPTMALAAYFPALLAQTVERGFVIGFGTGVTAGELGSIDSVEEVVVAEISPGVIEGGTWFEHGNRGALENPKTRILRSDAYRALLRTQGEFDVIVSEPSNPWVTGVEMLFSREFLSAARDRLSPGGVYSQWFHIYESDAETVALVLRTYAEVFDEVAIWYAGAADLLLLGFADDDSSGDIDRLLERAVLPDFSAGLARSGIHSIPALLVHEIVPRGVIQAAQLEGPVHTLLHPILSHQAARAFFPAKSGKLPVTANLDAARAGAQNSLLRRWQEQRGKVLTDEEYEVIARHTCREQGAQRGAECVTILASWQHAVPDSKRYRVTLRWARGQVLSDASVSTDMIDRVALLFGPASDLQPEHRSLRFARNVTDLFKRHYHHAFPFRRETLRAIWARCPSSVASACAQGRNNVERILGDLRVEAAFVGP